MNMTGPVELRHKLHQTPELMFREFKTTETIAEAVSVFDNIKISKPLETGLVAEYTGAADADYLLFRADIDALPVKEETGCSYSSMNDNMHACGHDVHSSILYGLLQHVAETRPAQNVLFVFQPGEEGGGGAEKVINSGILDNYRIAACFALHVTDEFPLGTIASTDGILFASAHEIDLEIYGRGAHVAFPSDGIHSFDALRKFLDRTDGILKTHQEKIILGYGRVESGTARNIIPALTRVEGTIRTLARDVTEKFVKEITGVLEALKSEMGIEYRLERGPFYNEVNVDTVLFGRCRKILQDDYEFIDCGYRMTGEDFGLFSARYPSFMFWLGTSAGEKHGLHNSKFLPSDEAVLTGIDAMKKILSGFRN